jgi:hypothetical protein
MCRQVFVTLGWLLAVALGLRASDEFEPPFRVLAEGRPIEAQMGHAAPFVADFDGDGRRDLLVGQFGGGALKVYRNVGSHTNPTFTTGITFGGTVPFG